MNDGAPRQAKNGEGEADRDRGEIRRFFDEMSVERNATINANPIVCYEQERRAETVLAMLRPGDGEKILDIGCGNARDIVRMIECGAEVVGVDISEGMVAAAISELEHSGIADKCMLLVGDATCLDFPDCTFDKILCSEVIEHIPDARQALREMWRVLKPGGRLVLSTPNKSSWYGFERYLIWQTLFRRRWSHPFDEWRSMSELAALVEEGRFKILERKSVCFAPGFLVTYFLLPGALQNLLISWVRGVEPLLCRWFPARGYTACMLAVRNIE